MITSLYIKDPTDGQWAVRRTSSPGRRGWRSTCRRQQSDYLYAYSYAVCATLRHCLTRCGDTLTRENLMKQATSMKDVEVPMLLPGIRLDASPKDYYPIQSLRLAQFDGKLEAVRRHPVGRQQLIATR